MIYFTSQVCERRKIFFSPRCRLTANQKVEDAMELYTAEELATLLKTSKDTIWRWGRQGKLPKLKIGRLVRFGLPEGVFDDKQRKDNESL